MVANSNAGGSDAGSTRLTRCVRRKVADESGQADAARLGLCLKLMAHVVIQPDRDREAHTWPCQRIVTTIL